MTAETAEVRLKRLRLRSWRRGTREMDLILGRFADTVLPRLDADELTVYEAFLGEDDHDLYAWLAGRSPPPPQFAGLVDRILSRV